LKFARDIDPSAHTDCAALRRQPKNTIPRTWLILEERWPGMKFVVSFTGNQVLTILITIDSLDKRSANAPLSTEFEKVAADFFSGRAVEAE
jgi:hypothetical protein